MCIDFYLLNYGVFKIWISLNQYWQHWKHLLPNLLAAMSISKSDQKHNIVVNIVVLTILFFCNHFAKQKLHSISMLPINLYMLTTMFTSLFTFLFTCLCSPILHGCLQVTFTYWLSVNFLYERSYRAVISNMHICTIN